MTQSSINNPSARPGAAHYKAQFHLDATDFERIAGYGREVLPHMERYLVAYMDWVAADEEWSTLFPPGASREDLRSYQKKIWTNFFAAEFDDKYVESKRRMGDGNARAGMTPNAYLAGMHESIHLFTVALYDGDVEGVDYLLALRSIDKLAQAEMAIGLAAYVARTNRIMAEQFEAITEMSTPVSEVGKDVLMLPVVGIVDSKRAADMMRTVLSKISETHARVLIIDIKGVGAIDSAVANHLIKIAKAAQLMGCRSTIAGVSPTIAQTIVELGIDVGAIRTTSQLQDALAIAFSANE